MFVTPFSGRRYVGLFPRLLGIVVLGVDLLQPSVQTITTPASTVDHWGKSDLKILLSQDRNITSDTPQIAPNGVATGNWQLAIGSGQLALRPLRLRSLRQCSGSTTGSNDNWGRRCVLLSTPQLSLAAPVCLRNSWGATSGSEQGPSGPTASTRRCRMSAQCGRPARS